MNGRFLVVLLSVICVSMTLGAGTFAADDDGSTPLSPCLLAASDDGKVYVAETTACQVAIFDIQSGKVLDTLSFPAPPTGIALSPDETTLYVTTGTPEGILYFVSVEEQTILDSVNVGYGACSPVVRPDGERVYVCNRYENDISVVDVNKRRELVRIAVGREPRAAEITLDGNLLFVASHLPSQPANQATVRSSIHVIHTGGLQKVREILLPNGSTCLEDICVSNDGEYLFVTHVLARFHMPTTQLERGWMNTNAVSILSAEGLNRVNTVLLDDVDRGAANPWGITCTEDDRFLCVAHSGTHELSVIDLPALLDKLAKLPRYRTTARSSDNGYSGGAATAADVPNDLSFLADVRRRIDLKGTGPRDIVAVGEKIYVANYFSDDLSIVDISNIERPRVERKPLSDSEPTLSVTRRGEQLFHDADICFQGWQSCASCHPDGRVDGLNWDLLNDGLGNPKNTKSLLYSHETPPAMSLGVRGDAKAAVRSGIRHILFQVRPEEDAHAIDLYLQNLNAIPSPLLKKKKLASSVKRGEKLFHSTKVGCAECHSGEYYTDMKTYDVGTKSKLDWSGEFDTPTLIEIWRTAPYLHDGRSTTLRDVLTIHNPSDKHGVTSHLSEKEIADLEAFLLSL